jgi:SH3 domain
MLNFGDVRLQHPNTGKALDTYVRQVLMQDEEWPKDFNKWDPEGTDWGWISSSHTATVPARMQGLMKKHGFIHSRTGWGETCYDLSAKDQRELPKSLDSILVHFPPRPKITISNILPLLNQAIALFTFDPDRPGDLGFKKGDIITVIKKTDKAEDWW